MINNYNEDGWKLKDWKGKNVNLKLSEVRGGEGLSDR